MGLAIGLEILVPKRPSRLRFRPSALGHTQILSHATQSSGVEVSPDAGVQWLTGRVGPGAAIAFHSAH
jgi:hypothetical protein